MSSHHSLSPSSMRAIEYQKITLHDVEFPSFSDSVVAPSSSSGAAGYAGEESANHHSLQSHDSLVSYFNRSFPLFGACVNFVNSIVGAGIIGMPIAIRESGFFAGVFLLLAIGVLIDQSVIMLVQCGIKNNKNNLEELCYHLFGKRGYDAASFFMFLYAFGAMIAYMVIVGDTVPITLSYFLPNYHLDRNVVILILAIFIILPLCLLRDMSSLAWTSFLSILADFILIIFVIISGPTSAHQQQTEFIKSDLNFIHYQLFLGIGTFSFAFVCQHNTFLVYQTLPTPNLRNWSIVAHVSLTIAVTFCLMLGLAGYLSFGQYTEGDILNNFTDSGLIHLPPLLSSSLITSLFLTISLFEDKLILVGRLLLASTMVFTFPMECYVARHIIFSYYDFFNQRPPESTIISPSHPPPQTPSSPSRLRRSSSSNSRDSNMSSINSKSSRSSSRKILTLFSFRRDNPILQHHQREENYREEVFDELELPSHFMSPIHSQAIHHPEDIVLVRDVNGGGDGHVPSTSSQTSPPLPPAPPKSLFVHVSITLLLWGTTLTIALVFSELSIILALTGAIAASALGYIIPSVVYLQTYRHELNKILLAFESSSEFYQPNFFKRINKLQRLIFPCWLFIFGIFTLFIGVGTVIYESVQS